METRDDAGPPAAAARHRGVPRAPGRRADHHLAARDRPRRGSATAWTTTRSCARWRGCGARRPARENSARTASTSTYCSNIHPGESWAEVRANLERYLPAVRDRVLPGRDVRRRPAACPRARPRELAAARVRWPNSANSCATTTSTSSPSTAFRTALSTARASRRTSTCPTGATRSGCATRTSWPTCWRCMLPPDGVDGQHQHRPGRVQAGHARPQTTSSASPRTWCATSRTSWRSSGAADAISRWRIEPEPHCFLETIDEIVRFFREHLFSTDAANRLAELTGLDRRGGGERIARPSRALPRPVPRGGRVRRSGRVHPRPAGGRHPRAQDADQRRAAPAALTADARAARCSSSTTPSTCTRSSNKVPAASGVMPICPRRSPRPPARRTGANGACTSMCRFSSTSSAPFPRRSAFIREVLAIHRKQPISAAPRGRDLHLGRAAGAFARGRHGAGDRARTRLGQGGAGVSRAGPA